MRMYAHLEQDQTVAAAEMFRVLSDPLRLRLLATLAARGEMCVCELVEQLREPQPKVSQHLRVLRTSGLVESRRQGSWAHYKLTPPSDPLQTWVHTMLREQFPSDPLPCTTERCTGR
jgi:DNA-binding transcriptional ArsR family regulator